MFDHHQPLPVSPFRGDVLAGKVVLITGGATGIGFGCATAFGKHGAKVAIMGRRKDVLDAAVQQLQGFGVDAYGVQGDVRTVDKCNVVVEAVVAKYVVDVLSLEAVWLEV
jgi:peroxisomal 2,4-dienoyl-CoA reductase